MNSVYKPDKWESTLIFIDVAKTFTIVRKHIIIIFMDVAESIFRPSSTKQKFVHNMTEVGSKISLHTIQTLFFVNQI